MVMPHCLVFLLTSSTVYSTVNCWSSSVGSHYRRSGQFSLVTSCRANQVQTGGYCLLSSSQHCTSISVGHAKTRRRHTIPQLSPVVDLQPPRCLPITPRYCRGTLVCCSWSETLEQSSERYYYGTITTSVSKKTENLPILAILPGHYTVVSDCVCHDGPISYVLL